MGKNKTFWISILTALILRLILVPFFNFGDVSNSVIWGMWAKQFGLHGFYDFLNFFNYARPNQPPLTILLYDGLRYVYEWSFSLVWFVHDKLYFPSEFLIPIDKYGFIWFLKMPAILADIGLGVLVYKLSKFMKISNPILMMNLFLFNPVSWYDSVIYGQTDSILMLLGFSSLLLLWFDLPILAAILFAFTILFKATLLTLLPVIIAIVWIKRTKLKEIIYAAVAFVATIWVIAKPFAVGPTFLWLFKLYTKTIATGELPYLTPSAFNFWNLVHGPEQVMDSVKFIGLPAFVIGFSIFTLFLVYAIFLVYRRKNFASVLVAILIITMSAFLFLTRMHERYIYPVFIPLLLLSGIRKKLLIAYVVISILMLLNMYNGWWVPNITPLMWFVANPIVERCMSAMYLLIFIWILKYEKTF